MAETVVGRPCRNCGGTERYATGRGCVACARKRARAYAVAHPERTKAAGRQYYHRHKPKFRRVVLRNRYGLTPVEYEEMLAAQGGVCAVCGRPETRVSGAGNPYALAVDHDHVHGHVRGLLCDACNKAIGILGDDADRILSAAIYVQNGGFGGC